MKPVLLNKKTYSFRTLKFISSVFSFGFVVLFGFTSVAQSDDFRRLEDNINSLKSKIRESTTKDPKDIQKLYKLENELEKKQYLQKNKAR